MSVACFFKFSEHIYSRMSLNNKKNGMPKARLEINY